MVNWKQKIFTATFKNGEKLLIPAQTKQEAREVYRDAVRRIKSRNVMPNKELIEAFIWQPL